MLQRQNNFERKEILSEIRNAIIDEKEQSISFEYDIPVVEGVFRKISVKGFYKNERFVLIWLSALTSVWEGDYGSELVEIKKSFKAS